MQSLTVIIPHLNAPEELARCLAALAAQRRDDRPFDIVVVDNGSEALPEAECAAYPFVALMDEPTPGPGPARNRAARMARTDLLAFIDCDCIAQPGWIDTIFDHLAAHPETGAIGGDVRIAYADPDRLTAIEAYESVYGYRFRLYIEQHNYTGAGNMAVRREVFERVGEFGGIEIAEDMDWGHRATAMGVRIDYVDDMRIATPARDDFRQLARKWDRHIGHDFEKLHGAAARLRWLARALALAVSPVPEAVRIARTDRVSGFGDRWRAFRCLVRIRLYRCRRMLQRLWGGGGQASAGIWRNDP